jgi:hypothetical protein
MRTFDAAPIGICRGAKSGHLTILLDSPGLRAYDLSYAEGARSAGSRSSSPRPRQRMTWAAACMETRPLRILKTSSSSRTFGSIAMAVRTAPSRLSLMLLLAWVKAPSWVLCYWEVSQWMYRTAAIVPSIGLNTRFTSQ